MNDGAQVGNTRAADYEDLRQGAATFDTPIGNAEAAEAFYREPRRLLMALAGGALVLSGIARRSAFGLGLAVAGVSLGYRAVTGRTLESLIVDLVNRRRGSAQPGEQHAATNGREAAGPIAH